MSYQLSPPCRASKIAEAANTSPLVSPSHNTHFDRSLVVNHQFHLDFLRRINSFSIFDMHLSHLRRLLTSQSRDLISSVSSL